VVQLTLVGLVLTTLFSVVSPLWTVRPESTLRSDVPGGTFLLQ
jgi:hypothetical protein